MTDTKFKAWKSANPHVSESIVTFLDCTKSLPHTVIEEFSYPTLKSIEKFDKLLEKLK